MVVDNERQLNKSIVNIETVEVKLVSWLLCKMHYKLWRKETSKPSADETRDHLIRCSENGNHSAVFGLNSD